LGSLIYYNINFTNRQGDDVLIRITDRQDYDYTGDNPITQIDLIGYAPALELETFNVNEDKFNPILGLRATIKFKSTSTVNFSTFSTGADYRFWVRVTVNSTDIPFNGWLVMDDNQQAFLPPGQPVVLTATDNFGSLKDIEFSDSNGARPSGKHRIIEIISWCLRKTEGPYPSEGAAIYDGIKVAMNLFEGDHHSTVNNCPLNQTYIDVRTFEKNVKEFENCNTVLTKILISLNCRVCQYNNFWYILRIDEYKNSAFVVHNYGLGGNYISRTLGATFDKDLDGTNIFFIKAQTLQRIQRPYKSSSIKKNYQLPEEFFPNMNFEQGDVIDDVPPTRTFNLDNWTLLRGEPGAYSTVDAAVVVLIQRTYTATDYVDEHYISITPKTNAGAIASTDETYIESEPAYICVKDKFTASIDWRTVVPSFDGGLFFIMLFTLHGDDGSWWQLGNETISDPTTPFKWWDTSNFTLNTGAGKVFIDFDNTDTTEWQTQEIEAPPAPVTGTLYVRLHQLDQTASLGDNITIHYQNFSINYSAYINGTYRMLTGEQFKMSTEDNYTKKFDEEFYLFDAPCKMFKGAMFYFDSPNYLLTAGWIDFAMEQYAIPDILDLYYRFLHWQTNAVWNQNRLETWVINSYLFGLDTANGYVGLIHKYSILDQDEPVNRMSFIILSMRQNWHDCTWQATLAEINDSDNVRQGGGTNGENFEFKYLEE
jgi:hypothetical protein